MDLDQQQSSRWSQEADQTVTAESADPQATTTVEEEDSELSSNTVPTVLDTSEAGLAAERLELSQRIFTAIPSLPKSERREILAELNDIGLPASSAASTQQTAYETILRLEAIADKAEGLQQQADQSDSLQHDENRHQDVQVPDPENLQLKEPFFRWAVDRLHAATEAAETAIDQSRTASAEMMGAGSSRLWHAFREKNGELQIREYKRRYLLRRLGGPPAEGLLEFALEQASIIQEIRGKHVTLGEVIGIAEEQAEAYRDKMFYPNGRLTRDAWLAVEGIISASLPNQKIYPNELREVTRQVGDWLLQDQIGNWLRDREAAISLSEGVNTVVRRLASGEWQLPVDELTRNIPKGSVEKSHSLLKLIGGLPGGVPSWFATCGMGMLGAYEFAANLFKFRFGEALKKVVKRSFDGLAASTFGVGQWAAWEESQILMGRKKGPLTGFRDLLASGAEKGGRVIELPVSLASSLARRLLGKTNSKSPDDADSEQTAA